MDKDSLGTTLRGVTNKKTQFTQKPNCTIGIMCVLCLVSVSSSVWREFDTKGRLSVLEDRVAYLELRSEGSPQKGMEGLFERYRREAVYQLKRRVLRDVTTDGRRLREIPECLCPTGSKAPLVMVMCFVPDCKHYSERKRYSFLTFPANPIQRRSWISLISKRTPKTILCPLDEQVAGPSSAPDIWAPGQTGSELDLEDPPSCSRSTMETSVASLEAENYFLKQDLEKISQKLKILSSRFSYELIKNNDSHVLMYTGIPTNTLFIILYETMDSFNLKYYARWQVKLLPKIDQMLMTLMKLRLNLPHENLAIRFECSSATVTNIVTTWISALHEVLFNQLMKTIPSRQKNQTCLPAVFSSFKNCRIILDCTELYSAVPTNMESQRLTFSSYKHRNTWKVLVGVAPNGVVTFVSKAYPGSSSDKKIVEHCEILKQMVHGDLIIADKGFLIQDLLPEGVYGTKRIAKARIHVERAIRRIKGFSILNYVPQYYISQISIIFQLCAALTNFQYPLIKEVEEYYS